MNYFKWIAGFIVIIILQSTIVPLLAIYQIRPDFLLIAVFVFALEVNQIRATITGFLVGVLQDLLTSGGIIGLSALTKSITGFTVGFNSKRKKTLKPRWIIVGFIVISLLHDIIFYFVLVYTLSDTMSLLKMIVRYSIPTTLYSSIFLIILFMVQRRI